MPGENATPSSSAEQACEFVIARVKAQSGHRYHQGPRRPPLACGSHAPAVRFLAEQRLHKIPVAVARALVAWSAGFPVDLLTTIPSPARVLALQAEGRRCVSLLPDGVPTAPHADALAFATHDLCHLDKLIDPRHYLGQVGFFSALQRALTQPSWAQFEGRFDSTFREDWQHVGADMNGSAVFLFAALKMKLKMAVRRLRGREDRNAFCVRHGPMTPEESAAYEPHLDDLMMLLGLGSSIAGAARATSAKRDDPRSAAQLLRHFEELGRRALPDCNAGLTAH
jgi:hypothetical protein